MSGNTLRGIRLPAASVFVVVVATACLGAKNEAPGDVHGYTPKRYVHPKEPEVKERLEWFKDQKLALFMHWGLYSTIGIKESWPLVDTKVVRRDEITWTKDFEAFKRQYMALNKVFNPIRFEPKKWAEIAKRNGFRYVILTTKHLDGFCLWDTKYSDYKVTAPECPFSVDRQADIVKHVFDAFRAEGLGIAAYFSKPDYHHEDYWEGRGLGRVTTHMPTYDVKKNPEKWARFRTYVRNQIVELVRDYGKIDIMWLDGGQVAPRNGLDIGIEEIIAEARKYNPALIAADRTVGGPCENFITPEQTVPRRPVAVPWESCVTIGKWWGYHYDDEYKSVRQIVQLLIDVVSKGGNLALNVGPQPDGRLPHQAVKLMDALGAWLKVNGEAIYETRPLPPYRKKGWAFTRNRRTGAEYAIRLYKENEVPTGKQTAPGVSASKVVHVASGITLACTPEKSGSSFHLPPYLKADPHADVFRLVK